MSRGPSVSKPEAAATNARSAPSAHAGDRPTSRRNRAEAAEQRPGAGRPLEEVGTVPLQRQWATVREDYGQADGDAWDYSATTRPGRGVPLGRGRAAAASPTTGHGCASPWPCIKPGTDPIRQGAAVRADQQRGQPRREHQGALLLRRLDADALVRAVPLQYPQREYPYRDLVRRTGAVEGGVEYELPTPALRRGRYFDV